MTHDPDLTPTEEQVRRLLADARHTEPMPEDVAARLDGVLAGLAAGGADGAGRPRPSELPHDLAAARRRRTARNLLVAAAAVVVVGVGVDQVGLTVSGGGEDSADSSAGGDEVAGSTTDEVRPESQAGTPRELDGLNGATFSVAPVRLTSEQFGTQVRRLQAQRSAALSDSTASDGVRPQEDLNHLEAVQCPTTGWGGGRFLAVRYDGDLGALVFRRVRGDTQVVDLFLCGSDEPARSVTLPVR